MNGHPAGPDGTAALVAWADARPRSIEYWLKSGVIGGDHLQPGSGGRRSWSAADFEIVWALARLAELGCLADRMSEAGAIVAARPVLTDGEVLIVELEGRVCRLHHACFDPTSKPAWVIPLRRAPIRENAPAAATAEAS